MALAELQYLVGPLRHASARLFIAVFVALAASAPVHAQAVRSQQPTKSPAQLPTGEPVDQLLVDKLVWSAVAALDQANRTGNYSVLRDLGAPSFQTNNSAATLAGIFEHLRNQHIDLSNALIVSPVYEQRPAIQGNALRAKGIFPLRTAIGFDLLFQNVSGEWRLLGLYVAPLERARKATKP